MTTGLPPQERVSAFARGRAKFRRWRRTRPFWGGLLTLLAGLETFATTQGNHGVTIHMGPTGFLSWLLPVILVTCGVLIWFSPQQRLFYAIVAAITSVFTLIGVNLGGFLIGMLLGVVGSALAFAWAPVAPSPVAPDAPPTDGDTAAEGDPTAGEPPPRATMSELLTGPLTDTLPPPRNPLHDERHSTADRDGGRHPLRDEPTTALPTVHGDGRPEPRGTVYGGRPTHLGDAPGGGPSEIPAPTVPPVEPRPGGYGPAPSGQDDGRWSGRNPGLLALVLIMLSVTAVAVSTAQDGSPASAAPCPTPTGSPSTPAGTPTTTAGQPSGTASAAVPAAEEKPGGSIIGGIVDGVRDLLGIEDSTEVVPAPTPTAATPSTPADPPATAPPGGATPTPEPDCPVGAKPAESPKPGEVKKLNAAAGQPPVAEKSLLTGSKLTMTWMEMAGVVELPAAKGGTVKVLKFLMDDAVTEAFEKRAPTEGGRTLLTKSSKLTVARLKKDSKKKVAFYASRFTGELVIIPGLPGVKMTLTPEKPLPPIAIPLAFVVFLKPEMELVYVDSETLTAQNLNQTLI